jgi:hypothetical protein
MVLMINYNYFGNLILSVFYLTIDSTFIIKQQLQKINYRLPIMSRKRNIVNLPILCAPTQLFIHGQ